MPDHSAASVWNDHGVGTYLDDFISENGQDEWLINLAYQALPGSGNSKCKRWSSLQSSEMM